MAARGKNISLASERFLLEEPEDRAEPFIRRAL
jgi:hypothetical protein